MRYIFHFHLSEANFLQINKDKDTINSNFNNYLYFSLFKTFLLLWLSIFAK